MKLASLSKHLERFREAIYSIEGHCLDCEGVGSLLQYASGIQGVDYSAASEAGMYCRGVADYERQQELSVTPYLTAQAVFLLTWMALERLIGEMEIAKSKLGKIGGLCAHLKACRHEFDLPCGYLAFVAEWRALETSLSASYSPRASIPAHVDDASEGIYRVYCLRNHVFHGDFEGFDPDDESWNAYTRAMNLGTRLTALTLQMALMVKFKDRSFMETSWHHRLFDEEDEVSIRRGFSNLHLEEAT